MQLTSGITVVYASAKERGSRLAGLETSHVVLSGLKSTVVMYTYLYGVRYVQASGQVPVCFNAASFFGTEMPVDS